MWFCYSKLFKIKMMSQANPTKSLREFCVFVEVNKKFLVAILKIKCLQKFKISR